MHYVFRQGPCFFTILSCLSECLETAAILTYLHHDVHPWQAMASGHRPSGACVSFKCLLVLYILYFRPHWMHEMWIQCGLKYNEMWIVDYCDWWSTASVSLSHDCCANTAFRIEVLLGVETFGDPKNIVLDGSPNFQRCVLDTCTRIRVVSEYKFSILILVLVAGVHTVVRCYFSKIMMFQLSCS